ncbi:MAG TPA: hypothetical protein VF491_17625 [Vicinamibacterales bacterium]
MSTTSQTPDRELLIQQLAGALLEVVETHGPWHDADCPCDDTCDCSAKPMHDRINAALRSALSPGSSAPNQETEIPCVPEAEHRFSVHWRCRRCGLIMYSPTTGRSYGPCPGRTAPHPSCGADDWEPLQSEADIEWSRPDESCGRYANPQAAAFSVPQLLDEMIEALVERDSSPEEIADEVLVKARRLRTLFVASPDPAPLREVLKLVRNSIGDLRNGFARAVEPSRWVEQMQGFIDEMLASAPPVASPATLPEPVRQEIVARIEAVRDTLTRVPVPLIQRSLDTIVERLNAFDSSPGAPEKCVCQWDPYGRGIVDVSPLCPLHLLDGEHVRSKSAPPATEQLIREIARKSMYAVSNPYLSAEAYRAALADVCNLAMSAPIEWEKAK